MMGLFSFLGSIFKPAADLIDEIHVSDEERGILKNKLAEIESKVAIKTMELQQAVLESNAKVAQSEQEHGNWLSKSWRPLVSIGMFVLIVSMAYGFIEMKPLVLQIAGAWLGVYGIGRSIEKRKK